MQSIWSEDIFRKNFKSLNGDAKTQVLIIGGGIAGILTAHFLHKQGVDYMLVEKDKICKKTTLNTTAKITYQHGLCYNKIMGKMGKEKAKMYLDANKIAFDKLSFLCKKISCDFQIKDNFVYSTSNRKKLEDEMMALNALGFSPKFYHKVPLPVENVGGICFENQAQFNPMKFLLEISKELNIFENTKVCEIDDKIAVTNRGKISAQRIIVTTHFPFIDKHGLYFLKLYQHRSYVIALENAMDCHGMYVDEDKKGLSFRNYKNYLLLGGGADRTGKNGGKWEELRALGENLFPNSKEKFHWATQDTMSLDGVPYIGQYSKNTPNLYVASGFNKWGMTSAMISAMLLSDLILSKENMYSDLFNPSRSILRPQLLVNSFESTVNILSFSKKRCSHLGCALKWNKQEHSWDCACHGSRFDDKGKTLDNPANKDLTKGL